MAIPVADEEVQEPGREELPDLDPVAGIGPEQLLQLPGPDDLGGTPEARAPVRTSGHPFFQGPEHPAELLPEAVQGRVVREDHEPAVRTEYLRPVQKGGRHRTASRQERGRLVLEQVLGDGPPKAGRQLPGLALIHRAKEPGEARGVPEDEESCLGAGAALHRRQAPCEALQIQDGDLQLRSPGLPVTAAQDPPTQATHPVVLVGDQPHG